MPVDPFVGNHDLLAAPSFWCLDSVQACGVRVATRKMLADDISSSLGFEELGGWKRWC